MKKKKYRLIIYRNKNDFKYGSFKTEIRENGEITISGIDKRKKTRSKYLEVLRCIT